MMVRLAGVEPATLGLEVRCSIQLSYRRVLEFSRVTARASSAEGVSYARNYARQLPRHALAVGGAHNVVAIEHRARLGARDGHRNSLDNAPVHHVANGCPPEVVTEAPGNACLLACRDSRLPEVPNTLPPEPAGEVWEHV